MPNQQSEVPKPDHPSLHHTPIAIIGMASIFPMASNLQEYWDNIIKEVDCITEVPPSRWNIEDYFDANPATPDKTYCKKGGFIPDIEFDPMEFGLPPNILEVTDVSQLLSLIVAKDAMKDAGYDNASDDIRAKTGVILGVGGGQKLITPLTSRLQYPVWERVLQSSGIPAAEREQIIEKMKLAYISWEENSFPGMLGNVIAGRIANRLDLGGINCVVDAACAASLAAVKMASSELVEGRCDTMITGGVDTDNSIFMYMSFSKTPAFSKKQDIRPFDAESDGMMIGEGVGMLVLKRLEDAERDNDRIYAVIKGIGTSSDGKYKSIYAPRSSGQAMAVKRAYEDAGFAAKSVGLVEAHGTGTPAGDPTEFAGLCEAFAEENSDTEHVALGSVKSQIGHTKAAAGAASLIKTALALYHKVFPPTLNVQDPNPKLDIENSPFYINSESRPWVANHDGTPRRAGVSAFGFGGTNFHFALEEYGTEGSGDYRLHTTPDVFLLSAPTPSALNTLCEQKLNALQGDDCKTHYLQLAETSKRAKIPDNHARLGFIAESPQEVAELLTISIAQLQKDGNPDNWEHPRGVYYRKAGKSHKEKVVALFPGQGSQYLNMGKELVLNFPALRKAYETFDDLFNRDCKKALSKLVFPIPRFTQARHDINAKELEQTENAQPAIGAFSYGLHKLLEKAGFSPDFVAGHSFGELTALWAAGVLRDHDFFHLAKARGHAMAAPKDSDFDAGSMLAVKGDFEKLKAELEKLSEIVVANLNSLQQTILAGPKAAIENAKAHLKAAGYVVTALSVSAAFHTPLVAFAHEPFAKAIDATTFRRPAITVYSNITGMPYPMTPKSIKKALKAHMLNPVNFRQEIENIYAAGGTVFVEIGPRNILTNLVRDILKGRKHIAISLNAGKANSDRQLREAYTKLRVAGVDLGPLDTHKRNFLLNRQISAGSSRLTVKLNGSNYVSPKTQKAFDEALLLHSAKDLEENRGNFLATSSAAEAVPSQAESSNASPKPNGTTVSSQSDDRQADSPARQIAPPVGVSKLTEARQTKSHPKTEAIEQMPKSDHRSHRTPSETNAVSQTEGATKPDERRLDEILALMHEHQAETLRVHELYLRSQEQYSNRVFELLHRQNSGSSSNKALRPKVHNEQSSPMAGTTASNAGTVEQPAQQHFAMEANGPELTLLNGTEAPAAVRSPEVVPTSPASSTTSNQSNHHMNQTAAESTSAMAIIDLTQTMLAVVSDKTGYPVEMLTLEMDIEADLGIDSIKRVEILGAMQEKHPDLPDINPEELAELRTLGQIVDKMQSPEPLPTVEMAQVATDNQHSTNSADLTDGMLEIVSEKTGYPVEMLELEMDMEADLGIDSIKRVEILGAMQDKYPDLPQVAPEELAELRTLGQIVSKMDTSDLADLPAISSVAEKRSNGAAAPAWGEASADAEFTQALLEIVSDKTGYPAEMLEVGMDMEADLGIDSIKRVEILGAMQDGYPDLPQVSPEELSELRTLGQIVDKMQCMEPCKQAPGLMPAIAHPNNKSTVSPTSLAALTQSMLAIVSDKTGYPAEMLELEMDMEADLGIDSIKRVEILGAMQDNHPNLPQVNLEELAELRTLGGIVECLGKSEVPSVISVPKGTITNGQQLADIPEHTIARNLVRLKILPKPDFLEMDLPAPHVCVITDDGTETTTTLAASLNQEAQDVVVLRFPNTLLARKCALPAVIKTVDLQALDESHLQKQLRQIEKKYGLIGSFIHLSPAASTLPDENNNSRKALLKAVFFMAKHLKESLNSASRHGRASFMTVSRMDGKLGCDGKDFAAIDGGLLGLTKTLNLEWSNVFCRALDVAPELPPETVAKRVLAELHDPNRLISEVGITQDCRQTLVAEPDAISNPSNGREALTSVSPTSVFVVSGGAKGITAKCVVRLAQQHQCRFILLGRSALDGDFGWLGEYHDEASLKRLAMEYLISEGQEATPLAVQKLAQQISSKREIEETLTAIREAGGIAEYCSVDVTDLAAIKRELGKASERLGQITGIIHGAGVLSDRLIEKKTERDFESVYSTKIEGLQALLQCVPAQQLQHLILFSSAAGFYGNVGQADYAVANEILNKTAYLIKRQHPDCHVAAINWGPWDGGMVTPALKQLFKERNIEVIPVKIGTQILVSELNPENRGIVQTVIGGPLSFAAKNAEQSLRKHRIRRQLALKDNPFLNDHNIGGHPVLPTVAAISWIGNVCEQLYPGYQMFSCENYQVLKGIVFDDESDGPKICVLDLEETAKNEHELTIKSVLWSATAEGKTRYHYRAEIMLLAQLPEAPTYRNFDLSESSVISKKELYGSDCLFHGPTFQGVDKVLNISPEKLTMQCFSALVSEEAQGQFQVQSFNPFVADGQFQSMVIWARHFHNAGSLPLKTRRGEQYRAIPFGQVSYVSMEVKQSTDTKLVADIITHDADGRVYARVLDAEVTISKTLNNMFASSGNEKTAA